MRIGYRRVSTLDQSTARQLEGERLDKLFEDKASGKDRNRPALQQAIEFAREGDSLVIHSMDRLARNLMDLRQIVDQLTSKGVQVQFVKENVQFTGQDSPMSLLLLNLLGAFAEFERSLIRERQREGIQLAKKAGKYHGRSAALTPDQINQIRERLRLKVSKSQIAREFGVSRQTIYEYLGDEIRASNPAKSLTAKDIAGMRGKVVAGSTRAELAREYGVSMETVARHVVAGKGDRAREEKV